MNIKFLQGYHFSEVTEFKKGPGIWNQEDSWPFCYFLVMFSKLSQ